MPYGYTQRVAELIEAKANELVDSESFMASLKLPETGMTLQSASERVRRGSLSPVELTNECLARIEQFDPLLNSFITVTAEQALAQAHELEAEQRRRQWRGPLHGIPIALKDLIDVKGVPTTAASAVFADRVATEDAEVVRRLREAGAVLLGKLNMQECAYGDTSVVSHYGPVRNPWNMEYICGGSSGGSAAAVAAGLCYGALGSDTGGSIRQPAAYCGIVGLKPTYGRVSTRGVMPLSWSMDHVGPMCRTVADTAILLQAIAGFDGDDVASVNVPVPEYQASLGRDVAAFRLGIPRTLFFEDLDPEIERVINRAIDQLRRITNSVADVELPSYGEMPIIGAEARAVHSHHLLEAGDRYQPFTRLRLERSAAISTTAYVLARRELDRVRREVGRVFEEVDLLITPTSPVGPAAIAEAQLAQPPAAGVPRSLRNTVPFDVYGLPTISIPCGSLSSGLPIGLQITGAHWAEEKVLALAQAYERRSA